MDERLPTNSFIQLFLLLFSVGQYMKKALEEQSSRQGEERPTMSSLVPSIHLFTKQGNDRALNYNFTPNPFPVNDATHLPRCCCCCGGGDSASQELSLLPSFAANNLPGSQQDEGNCRL